jgi:hypothetical protein
MIEVHMLVCENSTELWFFLYVYVKPGDGPFRAETCSVL